MGGIHQRKAFHIFAHEDGNIPELFGVGDEVILLYGGQEHGIGNTMRHIVLTAQLMCHGVYIAQVAVIEGQTGQEGGIGHVFTGLDILTVCHSLTQVLGNELDGLDGGSSAGLAKDKETLWWLNLLEIPPVVANQKNEGQNVLQLAIRSRFKFIYRPAGLGNRDAAAEKLTLTASGSGLAINNPTPFYITVSRISRDGGKALNSKTVMLAPQSSQTVALSSAVNRGETLTVNNINDYGADVAVKVAVK